jgi:ribosome biogenesis GTPase
MRELQLWGDEEALPATFPEIEALAPRCRFADCAHLKEPGCAVSEALESGELDRSRFDNYQKMQRELQHLAAKTDVLEQQALKRKSKQIPKAVKELHRLRGR